MKLRDSSSPIRPLAEFRLEQFNRHWRREHFCMYLVFLTGRARVLKCLFLDETETESD